MKGDFSRITNLLTGDEHYSVVLMQQGRVQLDSDWNAQALIQWFRIQNLAQDLIGEHGGRGESFIIAPPDTNNNDFKIRGGRYYIEGMVCENNDRQLTYLNQPNYLSPIVLESGKKYLVYLHAWLRHITSVEDGYICEVALGGPDTTTRIKNIWQVKVKVVTDEELAGKDPKANYGEFLDLIDVERHRERSKLKAQAKKPSDHDDLCIVSPESRYRGAENQLYRVEIHQSGPACVSDPTNPNPNEVCATFKWSRENGSVVYPIRKIIDKSVILEHLGRDKRFSLEVGDWVEVVDDNYELANEENTFPIENLLKVVEIERDTMQVTLSGDPQRGSDESKHPLLRRWDHTDKGKGTSGGALNVVEGKWIELEDGVEVMFTSDSTEGQGELNAIQYNTRDWWWITARTATGDVEWPLDDEGNPLAQEALDHGHRYAPLAFIEINAGTGTPPPPPIIQDLRRIFKQLWE